MQKAAALAILVLASESMALVFREHKPPGKLKKGQLEVWFVNLDGSKERKDCMEGQLKKQFIEPHRFPAVKYPTTCDANDKSAKNKNCFRKLFSDCMGDGIDWTAVSAHSKPGAVPGAVQKGVIANWCSHKRILDQFLKDNQTKDEKYYVILEDDIIISPKFKRSLESFIANYPGEWKYIQVDPFGAPAKQIAFHTDGPVTEPSKTPDKKGDNYGMHVLVVKQSAVADLQKFYSTKKIVPIDWITHRVPGMITWAPNIAQNPEGHNGNIVFAKPDFCKDGIYKSNIAGETEKR